MDLEILRAKVVEKRASAERIASEEATARASLAAVSEAAKAAEKYAHEKALLAVIDTSPEAKAKAEEAKANLAAAFALETEISDRIPLLSAARQKLDEEIADVLRDITAAENQRVAEVLTASLDQIDAEIVSISGRLLARARARGAAGWELSDLVKDRIVGNGHGSLSDRIIAEAEKVRATIASGRA